MFANMRPRPRPRPAGPGRAGGGLNALPPPFRVEEAQRLVSALGKPEAVLRTARWADAFLACCDAHGEAVEAEAHAVAVARYAVVQRPGVRVLPAPPVTTTLRCPDCGATRERTTPGGGGRPPKCSECGAWTRVVRP